MYVQDIKHLKIKEKDLSKILKKSGALEWAYIKHDKDETRPHLHVVLKFENPRSLSAVAKLFEDQTQYVDIWKGKIANAYSYLIHRTEDAKNEGKYQYSTLDVVSSFDFSKRMKEIEGEVKVGKKQIRETIDDFADEKCTINQLREKIGILNFAKQKNLIDKIEEVLSYKKHQDFLKDYIGEKCKVFWLYGESGVGKTKTAREVLEEKHPKNFFVTGSSRDHFQSYQGQNYIIINDLRLYDYDYGSLLTLLDNFELDKLAPARYKDKYLNALEIIITTPYDPKSFYQSMLLDDLLVDKYDQLKRRIYPINVTFDNVDEVKSELLKYDDLQKATFKIKKAKHDNHTNA